MELANKNIIALPKWLHRLWAMKWWELMAWVIEIGIFSLFAIVSITQFFEDEPRAGGIMILLTILLCGPAVWLFLGYKPQPGSKLGKYDIAAAACFVVWMIILLYLTVPVPQFGPGPFGSPV